MKPFLKKIVFFLSLLFFTIQLHAQKYEAEFANYSGTLTTADITGYSGSGCIRFENENEYVRVTANISESGTYKVYVAYASPYGTKDGRVTVNGNNQTVSFAENNVCSELLIGEYNLSAGNNAIEIAPDWTWFYVDYVRIESVNGNGGENPPISSGEGFRVSGTKLLDANGAEFVMRGVNMAWTWYKSSGILQLEAISRAGANCVRIVLSDGTKWSKDDASTVSSLINKCEQLEMIAILEVHDYTGGDDANGLLSAARYFADLKNVLIGKEKTVIINIANEWLGQWNSANWESGYKSAIPIIRNAGLNHCIMVDAGGWGQHAASVHGKGTSVLNADPNKNIIFAIHMYGSAGNTNVVKSNIDGVLNNGLALCIGEFGWYHGDGDVDEDLILSYCKEKNVGWLAWSWYGNDESVKYLDLVTSPGDETKTNNPSNSNWGQKIINAWKSEAEVCTIFNETGLGTEIFESNIADKQCKVYPTLITQSVNIECPANSKICIVDMSGRMALSFNTKESITTISCDEWKPGFYFLSIMANNKIESFKLIKQE